MIPNTGPFFVLAPDCDFRYGAVVYKTIGGQSGYMFVPNVNNRRPSRKVHNGIQDAIPRWARPYRLVPSSVNQGAKQP